MRKGFTLIELMVVIVVSVTIVGIGVVTVSGSLYRQRVNSAKSSVLTALKLARNYAVTSQSPPGFTNQLDYVSVTISNEGVVEARAANLAAGVGTSYFSIKTDNKNVYITPGSLLFSIPEGKILQNTVTPANSNYVMTIGISSVEGLAETMAVQIDAGGKIW